MNLRAFTCPQCGAPFGGLEGDCRYCGTHLRRYAGPEISFAQMADGMIISSQWDSSVPLVFGSTSSSVYIPGALVTDGEYYWTTGREEHKWRR